MSNLPRHESSMQLFSELFSDTERDAVLRLTRRFGRDEVLEALLHCGWRIDVADWALEKAKESEKEVKKTDVRETQDT